MSWVKGMQQNQRYSRIKKNKKIKQPLRLYSGLQAWFSSNKCENKCIPFHFAHHHTTLFFSTSVLEAAANER